MTKENLNVASVTAKELSTSEMKVAAFDLSNVVDMADVIHAIQQSSRQEIEKMSGGFSDLKKALSNSIKAQNIAKTGINDAKNIAKNSNKSDKQAAKPAAKAADAETKVIKDSTLLQETIIKDSKKVTPRQRRENSRKSLELVEVAPPAPAVTKVQQVQAAAEKTAQAAAQVVQNEAPEKVPGITPINRTDYFRDAGGKLRHKSGRYASKVEVNQYEGKGNKVDNQKQDPKAKKDDEKQRNLLWSVTKSMAKIMFLSNMDRHPGVIGGIGRTTVGQSAGMAMGGSYFLAAQEVANLGSEIKDALNNAGINSVGDAYKMAKDKATAGIGHVKYYGGKVANFMGISRAKMTPEEEAAKQKEKDAKQALKAQKAADRAQRLAKLKTPLKLLRAAGGYVGNIGTRIKSRWDAATPATIGAKEVKATDNNPIGNVANAANNPPAANPQNNGSTVPPKNMRWFTRIFKRGGMAAGSDNAVVSEIKQLNSDQDTRNTAVVMALGDIKDAIALKPVSASNSRGLLSNAFDRYRDRRNQRQTGSNTRTGRSSGRYSRTSGSSGRISPRAGNAGKVAGRTGRFSRIMGGARNAISTAGSVIFGDSMIGDLFDIAGGSGQPADPVKPTTRTPKPTTKVPTRGAAFGKAGTRLPSLGGLAEVGGKGAGMLGTAARVGGTALSKLALPLTVAMAAYDGFSGYNDTQAQQQTFGLKDGQSASIGQKLSMAAGSMLSMGGLTDMVGLSKEKMAGGIYNLFSGNSDMGKNPIVGATMAPITATIGALNGLFNGDTQQKAFNLKDGQSASIGQRLAAAAGGVASMGGLFGSSKDLSQSIYSFFGGDIQPAQANATKQAGVKVTSSKDTGVYGADPSVTNDKASAVAGGNATGSDNTVSDAAKAPSGTTQTTINNGIPWALSADQSNTQTKPVNPVADGIHASRDTGVYGADPSVTNNKASAVAGGNATGLDNGIPLAATADNANTPAATAPIHTPMENGIPWAATAAPAKTTAPVNMATPGVYSSNDTGVYGATPDAITPVVNSQAPAADKALEIAPSNNAGIKSVATQAQATTKDINAVTSNEDISQIIAATDAQQRAQDKAKANDLPPIRVTANSDPDVVKLLKSIDKKLDNNNGKAASKSNTGGTNFPTIPLDFSDMEHRRTANNLG